MGQIIIKTPFDVNLDYQISNVRKLRDLIFELDELADNAPSEPPRANNLLSKQLVNLRRETPVDAVLSDIWQQTELVDEPLTLDEINEEINAVRRARRS